MKKSDDNFRTGHTGYGRGNRIHLIYLFICFSGRFLLYSGYDEERDGGILVEKR